MGPDGGGGGADAGRDGGHWGEAVTQSPETPLEPGDIAAAPEPLGIPEPVVGRDEDTPLEEDEPEGVIPPSPLWAMKDRRHTQFLLVPGDRVRDRVGEGDNTVYVIEDGSSHVMVGRQVGEVAGQCHYCLVGRAPVGAYWGIKDGTRPPEAAFDDAREITLCGVTQEDEILTANVFDVAHYRHLRDVPGDYLPGAPYLRLDQPLDTGS